MLYVPFSTAKEYIIGVEDVQYYPLFDFRGHDTSRPSFTKDLLAHFFESENLAYRFVALPIKRFDKWFVEHSIDFKFPDNFRWREDSTNSLGIHFSEPVLKLTAGTYVLKKNQNIDRKSISSLATIRGFYPTLWIDEVKKKQVVLYEEALPIAIVKQIIYGYSDATNIDANVLRHYLKKVNNTDELVLAKNIHSEQYHYHFSTIYYPEIIEKFNQYLKNNQDYIAKLKAKYNIQE